MKKGILALVFMALCLPMFASGNTQNKQEEMTATAEKEPIIDIVTSEGTIKIKLYNDTPLHRDNFLKLVDEGMLDSVLFHRVIKNFMIQTGDPDSKNAKPGELLGGGGPDYRIPAEIVYPRHYHKRGALGAARDNNPAKSSSGSQFYIVTGRTFGRSQIESGILDSLRKNYWEQLVKENEPKIEALYLAKDQEGMKALENELREKVFTNVNSVPEEIAETYVTEGGAPHLDGEYTVFGEVVEGMDVVDKIGDAKTDDRDRPLEDIRILSIKVEK